jgi:sugar phosphate isomerase/epimerase
MTPLSYQLYSSRNFGPLDQTLKMLGKLGYSQVEGWGGLYAQLDQLDRLKGDLDANGLHMATGHVGFDMLREQPDRVKEMAKRLDMRAIFVPAPPDPAYREGKGDWAAFARDLAEAGKPYWDAGLHFGYHNHHWEFAGDGDIKPLDVLMEASEHMMLEFDVAWAVRGHQAPLTWIQKYKDRIMAAHVKDIARPGENADEDGWADVGHGTMDWKGLWTALTHAECEYFVMEHDNPKDDRRFAERSIAAVRAYE